MNLYKIEEGDLVNIHFTTSVSLFRVFVTHRPQDTGDSWVLKDDCDKIYYVQLFEKMELVEKKGGV